MKLNVEEEFVLLISVLKWVFLAGLVGVFVGLLATAFISVIHYVTHLSAEYEYSFYLLPFSLFVTSLIAYYTIKEDLGTNKLIQAINKNFGKIHSEIIPIKVLNVVLILATGGSAGKESPCAQIGAGVSGVWANLLKLDDIDRRKLVVCGFSAGFACVFGTPIAGAIYGVEVLFIGVIMYETLLPAFISSLIAFHISSYFGITYFRYPLQFVPVFNNSFLLVLVFAGIFFGVISYFFIHALRMGEEWSRKIKIWDPLKGIIGGVILVILTLTFSREYLGLGLDRVEATIKGVPVDWYAFILKAVFTIITLSISRSGSVITPIFFIGATSGSLFAEIFNLDKGTFAALGFVSLLSGTTNTPISTSIMAVEMFGAEIAPYAAVACVISFLMSGHTSLYSSQILTFAKSRNLTVELGKELKDIEVDIKIKDRSTHYFIYKMIELIRKIFKKV